MRQIIPRNGVVLNRRSKVLALVGCLALLFFFSAIALAAEAEPKVAQQVTSPMFAKPMSDEDAKYLGLEKAGEFTFKDIKAPYVLVEQFSTTCPHCMHQAPVLNNLFAMVQQDPKLKEKVKFLAVGQGDGPEKLLMWKAFHKVPFPLIPDPNSTLGKALNFSPYPVTVVMDKAAGKIAIVHVGAFESADNIFKEIIGLRISVESERYALDYKIEPEPYQDRIKYSNIKYYNNNQFIKKSSNKVRSALKAVFSILTDKGHGSGFIINPEGFAITNYHVVGDRKVIDAIFSDGKIIKARVIKTIPYHDLALIKLSGTEYNYLPIVIANDEYIGREIYVIGAPFSIALSHSVSKGVVSGIRKVDSLNLIQTDAPVNAGNSGGPMIDSNGFVIGMVTLKINKMGFEGLGFAISSNDIINNLKLNLIKD